MVLEGIEHALPYAAVVLVSLWGITAVLLLGGRYAYDRTGGRVRRTIETLSAADDLTVHLDRLPRSALERTAADTSTPEATARALSKWLVGRWGVKPYVERARRVSSRRSGWKRVSALHILFGAGYADIMPLLESAIESRNPETVGAAVAILGHLHDVSAARLLIATLVHRRYPASRIATHLDLFPLPLAAELEPLLRDPSPVVRYWGVTLLSRYDKGREVAALADDPDDQVRKAVAESLGAMETPDSAGVVVRLLRDASWIVRAHAARALGDLQRVDHAGGIARLLADNEWWVRLAARESLVTLGDDVVPVVLSYLEHPDRFARNGAAEILQNLGLLDQLIEAVEADRIDASQQEQLRRILEAGGDEMVSSVILRWGPRTEALVQSLGLWLPEET